MECDQPAPARSIVSAAAARDTDIVAMLRAGREREAFALLFERYELPVYRLCCGLMRSDLADDAAQEAFVRVWRSLRTYDGSAALSTWIYTVARNSCFTLMRRDSTRAKRFQPFEDDADFADEQPPDAADQCALQRVQDAVQSLPERQRTVLQLFYWQDQSVDEVAEMLGIPDGTVKTLLHRARQRLATLLAGEREALL